MFPRRVFFLVILLGFCLIPGIMEQCGQFLKFREFRGHVLVTCPRNSGIPGTARAAGIRVLEDQTGRRVEVPVRPRRIVSLIPSLTEIVYTLDRGDLLVGATRYATEPAAAARLPRVGTYLHLDVERIVALNPDLCLAVRDGNPGHLVRRIEAMGIPVFAFDPRSLAGIMDSVRLLGDLLNARERAAQVVTEMEAELAAVDKSVARVTDRPGVFFLIDVAPMVSAGRDTFIDRLISRAGGRNLAATATGYPRYSWEDILIMRPEVVLIASMAGGYTREELLREWRKWPEIPAVRDNRVHVVEADLFDRPVPRLVEGLALLTDLLHPAEGAP